MKILDDEKDKLLNHEYDGIRELDNHMPLWWLWLFYFTIAFGVGYMAYYYLLGGPDQHEEYAMEMAEAAERFKMDEPEEGASSFAWAFSDDPDVIARGQEVFMGMNNLCFTCHGNAGEGLVGPNLTDDKWISGCSAEAIATSIITGFPDKGMVPYGSGAPLPNEDVNALVSYIGSLQGTNPANPKAVDEARAVDCTIE